MPFSATTNATAPSARPADGGLICRSFFAIIEIRGDSVNTFEKLEQLTALVKKDEQLRQKLLQTKNSQEPLDDFCHLAQQAGVDLSLGEMFAIGQEYSDNQCKSTNGGNPTPYDSFGDAYETFLASIQ